MVVEGDPSSRVVATDECGMIYRVYIETNSPGQDRIFAIKNPATGEFINNVQSAISTSVLKCTNNDEGHSRTRFVISGGQELADFYLNFSTSPITVSDTKPVDADMIKITPSTGSKVNIGSTLQFISQFCSSNVNSDLTYLWKISKDGDVWIDPADKNDESIFKFTVLSDIKYVKCEASYIDPSSNSQTISSNIVELTVNKPTFNVKIEGEGVMTKPATLPTFSLPNISPNR